MVRTGRSGGGGGKGPLWSSWHSWSLSGCTDRIEECGLSRIVWWRGSCTKLKCWRWRVPWAVNHRVSTASQRTGHSLRDQWKPVWWQFKGNLQQDDDFWDAKTQQVSAECRRWEMESATSASWKRHVEQGHVHFLHVEFRIYVLLTKAVIMKWLLFYSCLVWIKCVLWCVIM